MPDTMPPRQKAMEPKEFKRLLDKHKLNQTTGAERLGVSRHTVIRWLKGSHPISHASAALIREKLGK